jgi:hypothetical protein
VRYPYHRYLAYRLLSGDGIDEVRDHIRDLEFHPPSVDDAEALRSEITFMSVSGRDVREELGLSFFDRKSPSTESMLWIVETSLAREVAEKMLLDRVDTRVISSVLSYKFDARVTVEAVNMFRDGFWDTITLGPVDFAAYFHAAGQRKPDPPPALVPFEQRRHYASWSNGHVPSEEDLSVEEMIRNIAVDSYFRFKELSSRKDVDSQKQALNFAGMVLKTAPTAMRRAQARREDEIPPLLPLLTYPEDSVPTIEELNNEVDDD